MLEALQYRKEAALCRVVAGDCMHVPTGDVLRELAAEYEAKAERMEAEQARRARRIEGEVRSPLFV